MEEIDISKLKYILYARKSTTDESRQVRSISDQIADCLDLAKRLNLNLVGKPLIETKSAKTPHKRPVFSQMLKDIQAGKYDAILAWNPDRLARNMLEGGLIIDMIDNKVIKDLKFYNHTFTNDANGKMLLGMAFVLSKQYSDDLSQKVSRGVRRSFSEGKTPTPKHGYYKDDNGYYLPDGKNFDLLSKVWQMKLEGANHENMAHYANSRGYFRKTKGGKKITLSKQILSEIFKDPFYYGILIQKGQRMDLRTLYNFKSMITEEEYNQVQELAHRRISPYKKKYDNFLPLRAMVVCAFCGHNMYPGIPQGNTKPYLYFRCDNKSCIRKKKSIRSKVILDFIYKFLDKGLNFSQKEYDRYFSSATQTSLTKQDKVMREIHSLEGALKSVELQIKEIALGLIKPDLKPTVKRINEDKLVELENERQGFVENIEELRNNLSDPAADKLSVEQFLNLSKNAAIIVKSANIVVKDQICRYIFVNFTVDEEKVTQYQAKEPFATLLKQRQKSSSRGKRT